MAARRARAGKSAATGVHEYPRPQLQRENWFNLNGRWDFAIDADAAVNSPDGVEWDEQIVVPFAPETPASGVNNTSFFKACWYRRTFGAPKLNPGERLILHFGAVDHEATVWVNGRQACTHEGGYTPFWADVTELLDGKGEQTIVVRAYDDPHDLAKPRGKQDWRLEPHSIWYPRTSGIWQTVWLEVVPTTRIANVRWMPSVERWEFDLSVRMDGPVREGMKLRVRLSGRDRVLVEDLYSVTDGGEVLRKIALPDPGIDDARNDLLWWPWAPNLIDAELELLDADGERVDFVRSYTAMRTVACRSDRFVFNGRPMRLRLVLDQGYWPQSGLTAPDDDAFKTDIELIKALGFNGVRKHQKIEDPRFLYWADRMGLLVWEEMPSPYRFSPVAVRRLSREWTEAIERDVSHPCIIVWVPFNESWGVPDLTEVAAQREFVKGVYSLTKALDPTRPVIGNDGWEMVVTDIVAIHDYDGSPERITKRYERTVENLRALFEYERPGHRQLLLEGQGYEGLPIMLTEFGGIAFHKDVKHTWGYRRAATAAQFLRQYTDLLAAVRALPVFAGFCYTQFTDTYQEANGLVYMDRSSKVSLDAVRKATSE